MSKKNESMRNGSAKMPETSSRKRDETATAPLDFVSTVPFPELVFGLVGPIGVDLEYIEQSLSDSLKSVGYEVEPIRITALMRDLKCDRELDATTLISNYNSKIDYANSLRRKYKAKELLAALSISAIKRIRVTREAQSPSSHTAFLIRQLKTPEEVRLLRRVYGRQFILVSIYGDPLRRLENLVAQIKLQSSGTINDEAARIGAEELIERDSKEDDEYGQNLRDAFYLGDVFVDSNEREAAALSIERFVDALFGSNEVSPNHDEYGMYLARSASLRSADLSRQVGAALFSTTGEVVSLGSNEVPKSGGGTYWTGDPADSRDFRQGHDPNEINKVEIFADIISRLRQDRHLSPSLLSMSGAQEIVDSLLRSEGGKRYRNLRVMDLIEFGRIIHAEMSAICDAARNGYSTRGTTLYVTTFPCHICAKHIVASGIRRVVYLEPYPKSYARQLHSDSIQIEEKNDASKVIFQPFIGISPFRYRDLFEKGRRKDEKGAARKWKSEPRQPMIDIVYPSYLEAETVVVSQLGKLITDRENQGRKRSTRPK